MLPTSPKEQSSISQKRRKRRAGTVTYIRLGSTPDPSGKKKTSAWNKALRYIIYRDMFTLK